MNQILVTERIYVTPELRRKKKLYKFNFFLSVFLVCLLFSYYIYAEYDKTKNEEMAKQILASIDLSAEEEEEPEDKNVRIENGVLIVTLNSDTDSTKEVDLSKLIKDAKEKPREVYTTKSGNTYTIDSVLNIPSLGINYPVFVHENMPYTTDELLKLSITKFWGGEPNEIGNYVIVGHNYKNKTMFGKLSGIQIGDIVELTDLKGRTLEYEVYNTYIVEPEDVSCIYPDVEGRKELTLITCATHGTQRLVVKTKKVK